MLSGPVALVSSKFMRALWTSNSEMLMFIEAIAVLPGEEKSAGACVKME